MRVIKAILEALFWTFAVLLVLLLGMSMGYIGICFLFLLVPLLARALHAVGRRRGASVIAYLEQAVRLNLPLPQMISAAQRSENGRLSARLERLSSKLAAGLGISSAVRQAVPELRGGPVAALESAERLGRLPHTLQRLVEQNTSRIEADSADAAFIRIYPPVMVIAIIGLVSLICVFVMPKYETIFKDFGIRLPPVTQLMLDIARDVGPILVFSVLALILLWGLAGIWRMIQPVAARLVINGITDRVLWVLPVSHGYVRDHSLAVTFDFIADALHAGQPIDHAVDEAANLHVNRVVQNRLGEFAVWLGSGTALHSAARQARMPGLVTEMLAPATSGEQVADVFEFLARYYDSRFSRTRLLLRGAVVPLTVFFFAVIVTFVALSMLMPMTALINSLSGQTAKWRL